MHERQQSARCHKKPQASRLAQTRVTYCSARIRQAHIAGCSRDPKFNARRSRIHELDERRQVGSTLVRALGSETVDGFSCRSSGAGENIYLEVIKTYSRYPQEQPEKSKASKKKCPDKCSGQMGGCPVIDQYCPDSVRMSDVKSSTADIVTILGVDNSILPTCNTIIAFFFYLQNVTGQ